MVFHSLIFYINIITFDSDTTAHMALLKKIPLNWSAYFLQTFICTYFLLTPLLIVCFFDVYNPNNSAYNIDIISKHFFKIAAVITLFSYLVCIPFIFFKKLFRRLYFSVVFLLLYSLSILDFLHVVIFKSRANSSSYFSVFNSNQNETLEFVSDYSSFNVIISLIVFILIPFVSYIIYEKVKSRLIFRAMKVIFFFLFITSAFISIKRSDAEMYKEISAIKLSEEYANYKKEIHLLNEYSQDKSHLKVVANNIATPETYIFIIGESTSKFHMQLYGYERETTPELQKLREELILFNNIKSAHVHTIESLKDVFVLKDSTDNFTQNTLIDCFNSGGYSTFWLSNQSYLGENETPISAIAKNTTQQVYINSSNSSSLDENLLPKLKSILNKNFRKKVIFIHLMGTHLSYQDRYPVAFNVFKDDNISIFGEHADSYINQYDNAVLYNDYVVSEIIKTAKNINGIAAVTYFSDHGDEVYDFRNFHGHSGAIKSKYMTNVPFFIWGNEQFNSSKKELLKNSKQNINNPLTLKNFNHTIQDLFEVKSSLYQKRKSYFNITDSTSKEKELPQPLSNNTEEPYYFNSKIWVHRVNSLERLAEIEHLFKGMELDIVFEKGKLDIRHPPAKSIQLSFEEFLSNIQNPSGHYFWLDLKNLNFKNVNEINQRLNYLTQKFNLQKNIVVETTNPKIIPQLNLVNYSSYYLPNLAGLGQEDLYKSVIEINQTIMEKKPTAVSQGFNNYYIMRKHFSTQNKLIWALNLNWNEPETHTRVEKLLQKDPSIKICLVNYKTNGWR